MAEQPDKSTPESEDPMYEHQRFVVDPKQEAIRLDKFLQSRLKNVSRNKIQDAIQIGYIRVDGNMVKSSHKLRPGEVITLMYPRPQESRHKVEPENIGLDVVFEDNDLLVVNKPAGMVVHPGIGNRNGTLVNALSYYLQDTDLPVKEGNLADRPGLVHRIDKDTSGLLVVAKTELAMQSLSRQFFHHTVYRRYVALVWSNFDEQEGTIDVHIGRHPKNRLYMTAFPEGEQGKHAVTHFKVLEDLYYVSLIECRLETGRTHQIRTHLKYIGHPLFSDDKYGGSAILKGTVFSKYRKFVENCFAMMPRQALHAQSLGFLHPRTQEEMRFEVPLPEDFQQVLDRWRSYLNSRKELM